jgi:hypothetical protein
MNDSGILLYQAEDRKTPIDVRLVGTKTGKKTGGKK